MRPTVYLAGPITGLEYDNAEDWRGLVALELQEAGIDAFSPLRAKEFLRSLGPLEDQYHNLHPLSSSRGIMTRDRFDCTTRDLVFVNLLGSRRVSIGTVMEIAWADLLRKPIVCVMEEDNVHRHGMVTEAVGFEVRTLAEAVAITKAILLPRAGSVDPQAGHVDEAGVSDSGEGSDFERVRSESWELANEWGRGFRSPGGPEKTRRVSKRPGG